MATLMSSVALPFIAALLSLIPGRERFIRVIVALLIWLNLPLLVYLFKDVLLSSQGSVELLPGFVMTRLGLLFIMLTHFIFACAFSHSTVFFSREVEKEKTPAGQIRTFYLCACLFLVSICYVYMCDNLGYLWISIEATTLASAPLVYYARSKHALEATWKYLIVCSVGIAFALFGTVLIFAASQHGALPEGSLNITELIKNSASLNYPLLRLGFVFCLLGYGTKAGMFPLHSWLPDAHAEAPAPASAMLSGALLNSALFAILRISEIVAGHHRLAQQFHLVLGTVTVVAASFFLVRQFGLKRLWAYSSIENVGIMLVAIGLGSPALFFLQALNHSLAKAALFLVSGNVVQATGTKELNDLRGILSLSPSWAVLMVVGAFAVTGSPPFGSFISEVYILAQSADRRLWVVAIALIFALTLSFIAVCIHVAKIIWGTERANWKQFQPIASSVFPAILLLCSLLAGTTGAVQYLVTLP